MSDDGAIGDSSGIAKGRMRDPEMDGIGRLLVMAGMIGIIASLIAIGILALAYGAIDFFAFTVPEALPEPWATWFPLPMALVFALALGISIRYTGEHTGLGVTQKEYAETGRIEYRHLPSILLQCFISLFSGASVGPEGILVDATGGVGTWFADKVKANKEDVKILIYTAIAGCFGGFFGSPIIGAIVALEYMYIKDLGYNRLILPGLISASIGYIIFHLTFGDMMIGMISFPTYEAPHITDMIYAVPIAVVGAVIGMAHKVVLFKTHVAFKGLKERPISRAMIGGAVFGIVGVALPLSLFSGQDQLGIVLEEYAAMGVGMLLLLTVAKSLMTSVSFASGFKGGPIFPLLFLGGTMGMAIALMFPFIHPGVCVLVCMAAVMCSMAPMPLSMALMLGTMSQVDLIPVIVIGAVVGYVVSKVLSPSQPVVEPVDA